MTNRAPPPSLSFPRAEAAENAAPSGAPDLLTLKETAAWLRIHTSTLYRMVKRGQIPVFRVGSGPFSDWRFLRHAVERWMLDRIEGEAIRRAPLIDEATGGVIDEATGQVVSGPLARGRAA